VSELESVIREIATPFVESLGLEIWGIEISQFHKTVIRIYVDIPCSGCSESDQAENNAASLEQTFELSEQKKEEPQDNLPEAAVHLSASVDKCARISRHIGLILEVEDIIPSAYVLEVSSPGLSRQFFKLNQLHAYLGDKMEVVLKHGRDEWDNRRKFIGILEKITDTGISIHLAEIDNVKKPAKCNENTSVAEDSLIQAMPIEWEEIRIIKRVHIFNATKIVKKKEKKEKKEKK